MARKPVRALRARSSFSVGGVGRVYDGQLVRSDNPIVKGREQLFEDVNDVLGIVEQATKSPGQKRNAAKPAPVEKPAASVSESDSSAAPEPEEG
jgi:hypothetical protein